MTYPRNLLRLRPTQGVVFDTPPHEVGPEHYTKAQNVLFRNGFPGRLPGSREAYASAVATAAPTQLLHALNCENGGTNYWLLFEADGTAWAIEGTNATQIDDSLLAATVEPWRFSSALLNGVPVVSNGSDEPVYWAGGNLLTLPGWTATESCEFIVAFKFHLFALNISGPGGDFPSLIKWSDNAEPGTVPNTWTPAADNTAGSFELADSPGGFLCAYPLRDSLMCYKRSATYGVQFVGGNAVFTNRKLKATLGALTPRSVCDLGTRHLIVSDGDVVLSDGNEPVPIGEARVKEWLFRQLSQDNYLNLQATFHRAQNEVLISFPQEGATYNNVGLVYDVARDSFGVRDLPQIAHSAVGFINDTTPSNTWVDRTETWDEAADQWASSVIAAATDSLVLFSADEMTMQDTNDAVSLQAIIGKEDITFGEPERVKFVRRVHVRTESGFGELRVRVGGKMTPSDSPTWSTEFVLTEPNQIANCRIRGRYISVEIRTTGSDVWAVTGFDLEADLRGYH